MYGVVVFFELDFSFLIYEFHLSGLFVRDWSELEAIQYLVRGLVVSNLEGLYFVDIASHTLNNCNSEI